jgi:hypothetical protein
VAEEDEMITDEIRAEVARLSHTPDRDELRALLGRYFVGPITDEHVTRLLADVACRHDLGTRDSDIASFNSRFRWRGWAWNEEVSQNHRSMAPVDLMLMRAHILWSATAFTSDSNPFPQPKLYCPATAVGTWKQLQPGYDSTELILWHLDPDGTCLTNSPHAPENYKYWCVHREYGWQGHKFEIVLQGVMHQNLWSISGVEATETEMLGVHLAYGEKVPFRLRRRPQAPK